MEIYRRYVPYLQFTVHILNTRCSAERKKQRKKHIFDDSQRQLAEDIFGVAFDYEVRNYAFTREFVKYWYVPVLSSFFKGRNWC
jgi:hypothetical protein